MASTEHEQTASTRDVSGLLDKGLVQFALGNREAAISFWKEAEELDPGNDRAQDYLQSVGAIPSLATLSADGPDEPATEVMPAVTDDHVEAVAQQSDPDALAPPFSQKVDFDDEPDDADALPAEPVVPDVEISLRDARAAEAAGRLEEALKSADKALKRDPEREETQELVASLRARLSAEYLAELEPLDRVPVLRATDASILELSLDPIGGFLISQIDGEITIEELLTILGTFDQFRVLSSLHYFLQAGIIELR